MTAEDSNGSGADEPEHDSEPPDADVDESVREEEGVEGGDSTVEPYGGGSPDRPSNADIDEETDQRGQADGAVDSTEDDSGHEPSGRPEASRQTAFCTSCGAEIEASASFCSHCGADQRADGGGESREQYDEGGYDTGGYDGRGEYDEGGYDTGGYDTRDEYNEGGYDTGGYEQGGGPYREQGYGGHRDPGRAWTAGPGSDTGMAALAHLLALFLWILGPILIYALSDDPFVRQNAANATNWQIMLTVYMIGSAILALLIIGIFFMLALMVMDFVFIVIATIKAADGEAWEYPLTPELL